MPVPSMLLLNRPMVSHVPAEATTVTSTIAFLVTRATDIVPEETRLDKHQGHSMISSEGPKTLATLSSTVTSIAAKATEKIHWKLLARDVNQGKLERRGAFDNPNVQKKLLDWGIAILVISCVALFLFLLAWGCNYIERMGEEAHNVTEAAGRSGPLDDVPQPQTSSERRSERRRERVGQRERGVGHYFQSSSGREESGRRDDVAQEERTSRATGGNRFLAIFQRRGGNPRQSSVIEIPGESIELQVTNRLPAGQNVAGQQEDNTRDRPVQLASQPQLDDHQPDHLTSPRLPEHRPHFRPTHMDPFPYPPHRLPEISPPSSPISSLEVTRPANIPVPNRTVTPPPSYEEHTEDLIVSMEYYQDVDHVAEVGTNPEGLSSSPATASAHDSSMDAIPARRARYPAHSEQD